LPRVFGDHSQRNQRRTAVPTIDRDGVSIHYQTHGAGPPLLLSHGYGATCRMWDGQIAAFADRYRVIVWDMRGHGQSGDPSDPALYSQALTVGDMAAVLEACGVGQAMVGGLSLGGVMSLAFHLAYPERVRALMLFDTGPGFRNPEPRRQWNERAEARARDLEAKGLADSRGGAETRLGRHRSAQGLAGAARGMLAQQDSSLIDTLTRVAVPTLVLVGSEDTHFLVAADYMAGKIPGARKAVIPGAGHAANIDQPEAFNRAVEEFLAGLPAASSGDYDALSSLNRDYIHSVQHGDAKRFSEILADDFLCSNPDGSLVGKPVFLEQTARPVTISGLIAEDVKVRIMGDVAIIHARTSYRTADGEPRHGRYTDVWVRRGGRWLAVSAHVTR
jgi:pimeloyl-ACP methyl ester carboxylesterase/ketosteroid isomerase-like protein